MKISNILTPRSLKPSSRFWIYTKNSQGFTVDAGGQDITVTMQIPTQLANLNIKAIDKTNGAVSGYKFTLESVVHLEADDILYAELPEELSLADISCRGIPDVPVGVLQVSCTGVGRVLQISLEELERQAGVFEFIVDGIVNAPTTRTTEPFKNVFMTTFDYYDIQKLESNVHLTITNEIPGEIMDYT